MRKFVSRVKGTERKEELWQFFFFSSTGEKKFLNFFVYDSCLVWYHFFSHLPTSCCRHRKHKKAHERNFFPQKHKKANSISKNHIESFTRLNYLWTLSFARFFLSDVESLHETFFWKTLWQKLFDLWWNWHAIEEYLIQCCQRFPYFFSAEWSCEKILNDFPMTTAKRIGMFRRSTANLWWW